MWGCGHVIAPPAARQSPTASHCRPYNGMPNGLSMASVAPADDRCLRELMSLPARFAFVLLSLALAGSARAAYDFGPWPAGTSPQEIGKRVAENFVAKPHSNFNRPG